MRCAQNTAMRCAQNTAMRCAQNTAMRCAKNIAVRCAHKNKRDVVKQHPFYFVSSKISSNPDFSLFIFSSSIFLFMVYKTFSTVSYSPFGIGPAAG